MGANSNTRLRKLFDEYNAEKLLSKSSSSTKKTRKNEVMFLVEVFRVFILITIWISTLAVVLVFIFIQN